MPCVFLSHCSQHMALYHSHDGKGKGQTKVLEGSHITPISWVWVNSASWWWTGRPGVLRFMGSQRVRLDSATELNWTELKPIVYFRIDLICWLYGVMIWGICLKHHYRSKKKKKSKIQSLIIFKKFSLALILRFNTTCLWTKLKLFISEKDTWILLTK